MKRTLKRRTYTLTGLLFMAACSMTVPVFAQKDTQNETLNIENERISVLEFLTMEKGYTLPTTWGEATEQMEQILGTSAQISDESEKSKNRKSSESGNAEENTDNSEHEISEKKETEDFQTDKEKKSIKTKSSSCLEDLTSLGYLEESFSVYQEDDQITEDEYANVLDLIFANVIENQQDAENIVESMNTMNAQGITENIAITGEIESLDDIEVGTIYLGAVNSLFLKQDTIKVLSIADDGTIILEGSQAETVYIDIDSEEEILLTGDDQSIAEVIVVENAADLTIDGDMEVDRLIVSGSVNSLTVNIDCRVENQSGEKLSYTDSNGELVTLEADEDRSAGSSSSKKSKSGSSSGSSSKKSKSGSSSGSSSKKSKSRSSSGSSSEKSESGSDTTAEDATTTDTSTVETDNENVSDDEKMIVQIPIIESVEYTGELQIAMLEDNEAYEILQNEGGIEPGIYKVILVLKDPDNTHWENDETGSMEELELDFEILENSDLEETEEEEQGETDEENTDEEDIDEENIDEENIDEENTYVETNGSQDLESSEENESEVIESNEEVIENQ